MDPDRIVWRLVDAILAHDPDAIAGVLTERHRLIDSTGQVVEGRTEAREAWAGYFRVVPDYRIEILETFPRGNRVALVGRASGSYTPEGRPPAPEDRWSVPAAWLVVLDGGLVREWRIFADNGPLRARFTSRGTTAGPGSGR